MKLELEEIQPLVDAEVEKLADAVAVAEDADREEDAAFEVPIQTAFGVAKSAVLDINENWSGDEDPVAQVQSAMTEVATALTAAEAKITSLNQSASSQPPVDDTTTTSDSASGT